MADGLSTSVAMRPPSAGARAARARCAIDLRAVVALAALVPGCVAGCAHVAHRAAFPEVQELVAAQGVEEKIRWRDGGAEDGSADEAVRGLLAKDLTADAAVQIALLNNPSLQVTYEDLGIAQSELVQAGLLKNPVFAGSAMFGSVSPAYDFDIAQTFLDLLLRPARQRIAGAQLEQARLRVAGEVFALASQVRGAYYTLQGTAQLADLLRRVSTAAEASAEFAERLRDAGNASDLQVASEQALAKQAAADVLRAESETIAPREELRHLMGLSTSDAAIEVAPALPALPTSDPDLATVLALARERRLELAAARQEQAALAETLATVRQWRYLGTVDIGAMAHREQGERNWVAGPSVALDLPLFDQRQAEIARLESVLRQSQLRSDALALDIASEVRRAYEGMRSARQVAEHYRTALIPVRERVVALSLEHYNFMLLGTFDLLLAKQAQLGAYREFVASVRDYWIARADLERAVGARVANVTGTPQAGPALLPPGLESAAGPASEHDHSGHGTTHPASGAAAPPLGNRDVTMPPDHGGHDHGGH